MFLNGKMIQASLIPWRYSLIVFASSLLGSTVINNGCIVGSPLVLSEIMQIKQVTVSS